MENSSSSSPEAAPARRLEYVGFWKRLVASLIDTLIILVVTVPLLMVAGAGALLTGGGFVEGHTRLVSVLLQYVFPAVATIAFWRVRGATPGKMAVSARILDARTGGAPSNGQLVGRYFGYIVSALPLFLGFVWIGIDRRKQGFHDKLAGTVVVYDDD